MNQIVEQMNCRMYEVLNIWEYMNGEALQTNPKIEDLRVRTCFSNRECHEDKIK